MYCKIILRPGERIYGKTKHTFFWLYSRASSAIQAVLILRKFHYCFIEEIEIYLQSFHVIAPILSCLQPHTSKKKS